MDQTASHVLLNDWQRVNNSFKDATRSVWRHVRAMRGGHRIYWLIGDSVFRGYATKSLDVPVVDRLKPLCHPESIVNIIAASNSSDLRAIFSGALMLSHITEMLMDEVQPQDVVAFQDAGLHCQSLEAHLHYIRMMRSLCLDLKPIPTVLLTIPSADPATAAYRFDVPVAGGKTINDVIREAAIAPHPHLSRCRLLDLDAIFNKVHLWAREEYGITLLLDDGIHPNVWGNLVLGIGLSLAAGIGLSNLEPLARVVSSSSDALAAAYGPTHETPARNAGRLLERFAAACFEFDSPSRA